MTLAFDTSTTTGIVAVFDSPHLLASARWNREVSHGELLTPAISDCLKQAQLSLAKIERLVVGVGPGSFTGARISVNAARTFGYALDKSVYAVDTAELLAAGVPQRSDDLAILIKCGKNQIYLSTFSWKNSIWERQTQFVTIDLDLLADRIKTRHLCVGDGYLEYQATLSERLSSLLLRDPGLSDSLAVENFTKIDLQARKAIDWKRLQALYIKASSAEEKLGESLGKKTR